jgi:hypothetical protein
MKISTNQSPAPEESKNKAAKPTEDRQQPLPFYEDDLVARVRAAKAAAQRDMESFGDVSEYEIRKIVGKRTELRYDEDEDAAQEAGADQGGKTLTDEEA